MIRLKIPLFLLFLIFILQSCDGLKMKQILFETSDRAKYERQFTGSDSLMTIWKNQYSAALNNQLKIEDGYSVQAKANPKELNALGYLMQLKKGDLLVIETQTCKPEAKIFVDVFEQLSNGENSKSKIIENGKFTKSIENNGWYKIIVQPEIELNENFYLKIYSQPSFIFPVAGKGNKDAQSFWGADRDGGSRSHEGVDIFASRGTPVVAATDGFVSRTGNQGLGGKQVWLRDGVLGNSLYYAHLDSVIAQTGQQVKVGDTLGLVGNTGNAKGGATHLHFGVYSTGGATDAYPFIRKREIPAYSKTALPQFKFIKAGSNLRSGPGTKFDIINNIENETAINILAGNKNWFHIKTSDGKEGFINSGRLK